MLQNGATLLQSEARQTLLQSWGELCVTINWGKCYCKLGRLSVPKWGNWYYKVGQVLESGVVLLQSGSYITKWANYYKVGQEVQL